MEPTPRRASALTIAGVDPTGTAGLLIDLRTFAAFGLHGSAIATVITAQTTSEFRMGSPVEPEVVSAQLEAVLDDVSPHAVKVAMLWSRPIAETVANVLDRARLKRVVVDPVLADGDGNRIVDWGVDDVYRNRLIPIASVVTPNWVEAGFLLGREIDSVDAAVDAAADVLGLGADAVVVTGGGRSANVVDAGPTSNEDVVDVVATRAGVRLVKNERLTQSNVRGSGDTLSSAIAASLALGAGIGEAIEVARDFTRVSIQRGLAGGIGSGRPSVHPPNRRDIPRLD